jgi:hypothetical protein
LPDADWQHSEQVRVVHTNRREKCIARNAGAAIARGRYLHFLDDDDWLLPHALDTFRELAMRDHEAKVLYGGVSFVDSAGRPFAELNLGRSGNCYTQLVAGSWIPTLALLVEADAFFAVGGYSLRFHTSEDLDLCRRLALRHDFVHTPLVVGCALRGEGWNTSAHYDEAVEKNRLSRDMVLREPGAFGRLQASATSSYWHGRVFHAYLTSALWNLRRRRLLGTTSRATFALLSLMLAARHVFVRDFWRAVGDDHVPCTHARVMQSQ